MPRLLLLCLATISFLAFGALSEDAVYTLSENFQQLLTSTALTWMSATKNSKNFDYAVVGAYQRGQDESEPQRPIFICRAKQNGLWVAGSLRQTERRCIISLHGGVHEAERFEILVNIEDSARLSWVRKDQYSVSPPGAIVGGDEPFRHFVGRRAAPPEDKSAVTHYVGKVDPNRRNGIYFLINGNKKEREYEDGEMLVESEPVKYELSSIKMDPFRKRINQHERLLGEIILKNENDSGDISEVEAVISYNYTYSIYWGHGHGMLNGLPYMVHSQEQKTYEGSWGLKDTSEKMELFPVVAYLAPGTAVNATVRGEYTEADEGFTATITSFYKDDETRDRQIKDNRIEFGMSNVRQELGRVYFLHNNSFVPTTTTTTTTTTSTTTAPTTTTEVEIVPITSPANDIESAEHGMERSAKKGALDADPDKGENSSMEASSLKNKQEASSIREAVAPAGGAMRLGSPTMIGAIMLICWPMIAT